ncbi:cyclin-D3-1-like isoform X2 [Salvia miltiorrhiza]|uniref:cyclin-D3-1-like isoform X2 n=1 Tax=Salvia miltiorrhiza TaxID=226208 RepID=UPI0025AB997E|nr:cyclin-D3-1-like isoform X2 [Salvia miltiorrhiza]
MPYDKISYFYLSSQELQCPLRLRERERGREWSLLYFFLLSLYKRKETALVSMAVDHNNARKSLLLDTLYCEEEKEEEKCEEEESKSEITLNDNNHSLVFEYDDEEIESLLRKERETSLESTRFSISSFFCAARKQAVEFVLTISSRHGFSASAAVLAVNFVDRFLLDYLSLEKDEKRPWLMQLVAVACLSLAAKMEETHVPLLVDLQVEDAKYLFEAKTIKRMELLILSALNWRMNPVTPLSFIDHFVRRLGLKKSCVIHLEFLTSCENTILSAISDSRLVGYYPSVLATATMLHVVHQVQYCGNAIECEKMMLDVLKISKEVDKCYRLILDVVSSKKKCSKCELSGSSWSDVIINEEASQPNLKKHKI